jgi:hypothetical protein
MRVYAFSGRASHWGFTADETGANLPSEFGPWKFFKIINMCPEEESRIGVSTDEALADIERQGYHINRAQILTTEQISNP